MFSSSLVLRKSAWLSYTRPTSSSSYFCFLPVFISVRRERAKAVTDYILFVCSDGCKQASERPSKRVGNEANAPMRQAFHTKKKRRRGRRRRRRTVLPIGTDAYGYYLCVRHRPMRGYRGHRVFSFDLSNDQFLCFVTNRCEMKVLMMQFSMPNTTLKRMNNECCVFFTSGRERKQSSNDCLPA